MQLKSFLQIEIVNSPRLILVANLSLVNNHTFDKNLFEFFLTLLVAFSSDLKHA